MAKFKEKIKAKELRQRGYSIKEIAQKLKISQGSISVWCRDIALSNEQIKRLVLKQKIKSYEGRLRALETIRQKRLNEIKTLKIEGIREVDELTKRDFFIAGIAIYCSEGYTAPANHGVGITNSDYKIILFMLKWFKKYCRISDDRITLRVDINEIHKKRINQVEKYWSKITQIPLSQFNKASIKRTRSKKIYSNYQDYYGTLRIKIRRSTQLRRKIDGWIDGLLGS